MKPTFDKDGYPTDETLDYIRRYPISTKENCKELLAFCIDCWSIYPVKHSRYSYRFVTAGWSGNEAIIQAMQDNIPFWLLSWYSTRRGGVHQFLL